MTLCKVKGNIVSTNKTEKLKGFKLLVVTPFNVITGKEEGQHFVAVDTVGAGEGEVVMVVNGSSARQTQQTENKPVDAAIVAIIDSVEIERKLVFRK